MVKEYLKTRPAAQIERLKKRVAEGRIEITGMFCNMAETSDESLMTDFLRPLQIIQEAGFPVKTVMQNDVHGIAWCLPYTDNAPPSTAACLLVKEWNEKYEMPKLKLAVASEFFEYVEKNYADKLPVYQKALLDWWTNGAGSASRETAEVRKMQNLKQVDEGLFAMVAINGGELNPNLQAETDLIAENAIFYDEHTFGEDESIDRPLSENTAYQWLQKGSYAWEALKMQTLLHEEALARYQPFMKKADFPVIHVINSMGWKRPGIVKLFVDFLEPFVPLCSELLKCDLRSDEGHAFAVENKLFERVCEKCITDAIGIVEELF